MTAVAAALPEVRLAGECSPPHRNAAGKSEADGDQMLAEVAGTIRQVVRL